MNGHIRFTSSSPFRPLIFCPIKYAFIIISLLNNISKRPKTHLPDFMTIHLKYQPILFLLLKQHFIYLFLLPILKPSISKVFFCNTIQILNLI